MLVNEAPGSASGLPSPPSVPELLKLLQAALAATSGEPEGAAGPGNDRAGARGGSLETPPCRPWSGYGRSEEIKAVVPTASMVHAQISSQSQIGPAEPQVTANNTESAQESSGVAQPVHSLAGCVSDEEEPLPGSSAWMHCKHPDWFAAHRYEDPAVFPEPQAGSSSRLRQRPGRLQSHSRIHGCSNIRSSGNVLR